MSVLGYFELRGPNIGARMCPSSTSFSLFTNDTTSDLSPSFLCPTWVGRTKLSNSFSLG